MTADRRDPTNPFALTEYPGWMDDTPDNRRAHTKTHTDDKRAHSPFANSENANRAALVEKLRTRLGCSPSCCDVPELCSCQIAIDLIRAEVLEEAARVAETVGPVVVQQCEDGRTIVNTWRAHEIASAIRALKGGKVRRVGKEGRVSGDVAAGLNQPPHC